MIKLFYNKFVYLLFIYLFISIVVCYGSELFTHMAKTDIHVNSFTKSGTCTHYLLWNEKVVE